MPEEVDRLEEEFWHEQLGVLDTDENRETVREVIQFMLKQNEGIMK